MKYLTVNRLLNAASWLFLCLSTVSMYALEFSDITFLVVSDLHYEASSLDENRNLIDDITGVVGANYPSSVGGTVNTPVGVCVTGDITEGGGRETNWNLFVNDYGLTGENRVPYPVYEGWGNHDDAVDGSCKAVPGIASRNQTRPGVINTSFKGYHYSWDWEHVHFIHLNMYGGKPNRTHDNPKASIDFLIDDLAQTIGNSGKPVVIFQHFDFHSSSTDWWSNTERTKMYNAIKGYNIIAIMNGHSHSAGHIEWSGIDTYNPGSVWNQGMLVVNINNDKLTIASRRNHSWSTVWKKDIDLGNSPIIGSHHLISSPKTFIKDQVLHIKGNIDSSTLISIFDLQGRNVMRKTVTGISKIPLNSVLANGAYGLTVESERKQLIQRLIITSQ